MTRTGGMERVAATTIGGIRYVDYSQERVERFILKARMKRLQTQLNTATQRGFATTKVPLELLRTLLDLVA